MTATAEAGTTRLAEAERLLRRIVIVSIVDGLLLIPLVVGVIIDWHGAAPIIGPIHGVGFLYEIYLAARGAGERWWGWWYPIVITVTAGPPGALLGHGRARREAQAALA
jgi:hypothetical protein